MFFTTINWEWTKKGHCKDEDPDLFYELERQKILANTIKKHFCVPCPVRRQCLETAILIPERFGIWGGLSVAERNAYVRLRKNGSTHGEALRVMDAKWQEECQDDLTWDKVESYARTKAQQLKDADC